MKKAIPTLPMEPRCLATFLYKPDANEVVRRNFSEDVRMINLWANRMLHLHTWPVYILLAGAVDVRELTAISDPLRQLRVLHVPALFDLAPAATRPQYRHMFTKLHVWRLPCRKAAILDYDGWAVLPRAGDLLLDACGGAELCAVRDMIGERLARRVALSAIGQWSNRSSPYFNAGVFALRPSEGTYKSLVSRAQAERDSGAAATRVMAEQDFLNAAFPEWKELNRTFNMMGGIWRNGGPKKTAAVYIHERLARSHPLFEQKLWCSPRHCLELERLSDGGVVRGIRTGLTDSCCWVDF